MILVNSLKIIGRGASKLVYEFPGDEAKLIKLMNPLNVSEDGGFVKHGFLKRKMFQGIYRQFRRELLQYLQLCKVNYKKNQFIFPMETPYGFVETDQGLGLVVEKIVGPSGSGETVSDLCQSGHFSAKHAQALKQFFNDCCEMHVVFGEVNPAGIMYTENRTGRPEFVLVDGMGEKLFIPVRAIFKSVNANYVRKVEERTKKRFNIQY